MNSDQTFRVDRTASRRAHSERAGLNPKELAWKLFCRSHYVVIAVIAGVVLGREMISSITPRYTSSVSILIDPKRPGTFGADSEFANLYVDSAKVAGVVAIIESSNLLGRVVTSERLDDDPEFNAKLSSGARKLVESLGLLKPPSDVADTREARMARAISHLARVLRVTREGITYVVVVEVTSSSPQKAQRLAGAVADAYMDDQLRTKSTAMRRDYEWLTARLGELRSELMRSEEAVEAVRQKYGLTETDRGPGSTVDRQALTETNAQLLAADGDVAARRARYEQADRVRRLGGGLEGLPEVVGSPVIAELRKQETDARRRLTELSSRYTHSYPPVTATEKDLHAIEAQIDAEVGRIVANIRNGYESAVARRRILADQLSQLTQGSSGNVPSDGRVQLREAQRTADANRALHDALLNKMREVEQQQTRSDPEARIISPATEADAPSFPKPSIFIGGGGFGGSLLGAAVALCLPRRRRGFVTPAEAEDGLLLPVLGSLPLLTRRDFGKQRNAASVVDYLVNRPFSQLAECLRALRTSLRIGSEGGPHVIQLTSATVGEGKSTVAATLAISAALAGIRTALVDVDIRHSSISQMFGLKGLPDGTSEPLGGTRAGGAILQQHQGLPLTIIDVGPVLDLRPDVIASRRFATLVEEIAATHALVILDNPPVLVVSDALVIAELVDATLLVVESRVTPKALVDQALKALRRAKAPLVGVMLNKVRSSGLSQYGYGDTLVESRR